ncbi:phage tail sheath family protein [Tessaracoccus sp. Y36]
MATYVAPGVYIEEIPGGAAGVVPAAPAIAAFVGYTERATGDAADDLRLTPTGIGSMAEFERHFGGPQPETGITVDLVETTVARRGLPPGVQGVARLPEAARSKHVLHYALQLFYANGGGSAYVVSVGGFKPVATDLAASELVAGVEALDSVEGPLLIAVPEAQSLSESGYSSVLTAALDQCGDLGDRFTILDLRGGTGAADPPDPELRGAVDRLQDAALGSHLMYGAAYAPNLITDLDFAVDELQVQVVHTLDGVRGAAESLSGRSRQFQGTARRAIRALPLTLPPSGAVAGLYAATDEARGVWKSPANVALLGVEGPVVELTRAVRDAVAIPAGGRPVNAICTFAGRGTVVWGARTLAGSGNEWRYVAVRRFVTFVEVSLRRALGQFAFEPNNAGTWMRARASIGDFLAGLWGAGALQGDKPERAFSVRVGLGDTMTAGDIAEGRMVVDVGLAVVRPAEFIVVRFAQVMDSG